MVHVISKKVSLYKLNNHNSYVIDSRLTDDCGWEDYSLSFYSWSRIKASNAVAISPNAPAYDHTYNTKDGWYCYSKIYL